MFSFDNCLGYETITPKIEKPTKIKDFTEKIMDVGCGDRFTVILSTGEYESLPYIYPKSKFNQQNILNIKERKNIIMDILETKKKLKDDNLDYEEIYDQTFSKNLDKIGENDLNKNKKNFQKSKSMHSKNDIMETSKILLNELSEAKMKKDFCNRKQSSSKVEIIGFNEHESNIENILTNSFKD